LRAEGRWFLVNYALANAVGLALGLIHGIILTRGSADGVIPGWSGAPIEQVVWYAVAVVFFGPLLLGIPILAAGMVAWRVAIRMIGDPRTAAYVVAALVVVVAVPLIPRTDPMSVVFFVALPAFMFATLARMPPDSESTAPVASTR
jgi:hypothetical protein